MKKYLFIIITAIMTMICVCACDSGKNGNPAQKDKLSIVTTIFPEYDWVMNVLGERAEDVEVTMLLDNGVDLHSYQPTADDIFRIWLLSICSMCSVTPSRRRK